MTEPNPLEKELAGMRPRELAQDLAGRIQSGVADAGPWGDRLLVCAMGAGSLAACVIAVMLAIDSRASLPEIRPIQTTAQAPTIGAYSQALARADGDWISESK